MDKRAGRINTVETQKERPVSSTKDASPNWKEKRIYGCEILVFRSIRTDRPEANNLWATLPAEYLDADGRDCELYDWKADLDAGTIYARGAIYYGEGKWERVEGVFPCRRETVELKPPGRNFVWRAFSGDWRNVKSGETRRAE